MWVMAAGLPSWRTAPVTRRIAPYVRDVTDRTGRTSDQLLRQAPGPAAAAGAWRAAASALDRALGGSESVARRLTQAGLASHVPAFRGRQLAWAALGAGVAAGAAALLAVAGRGNAPLAVMPLVGAIAGAYAADAILTARARARVTRIEEEIPTVLEFLALCLSAGEGVYGSVRRVAEVGTGELTAELRAVSIEVETGAALQDALTRMSRRVAAPALTRAVEHIAAAIERGSPLAQVLQAQAADAREAAARALIESAGRKEILMMIPLVFGLLPLSVLFAIFPGIAMLQVGF
nr:type II secretion system F family protein [Microbacterium sp. ZXX196]